MQTKVPLHTLDIQYYCTGLAIIKGIRISIINSSTETTLGVFAHGHPCNFGSEFYTILSIYGKRFNNTASFMITNSIDQLNLTNREFEVLYCICLGYSNRKAIANFLSIIYKREIRVDTIVDDAFKGLYRKLPCKNTTHLMEFAIMNNLHLNMPKSFIKPGTYAIVK